MGRKPVKVTIGPWVLSRQTYHRNKWALKLRGHNRLRDDRISPTTIRWIAVNTKTGRRWVFGPYHTRAWAEGEIREQLAEDKNLSRLGLSEYGNEKS